MKKRLLSLLLILTLVLTFSIVGAQANETQETETAKQMWSHLTIAEDGKTATGYCPHCCDDSSQTVEWKLYTRTSGHNNLSTSGHYFLNESTEANGALQPYAENLDFVLHLNGKTYGRTGLGNNTGIIRPYAKNTTFSVVDDQTQEGVLDGNDGWVVNTNGQSGTKVVLYSGNMISDVTTVATTGSNLNGGTVYMTSGTFEMYGGTVNGTKAVSGGAIYATGSSTAVKLHGGTVTGGQATGSGGTIYINGGSLQVDGTCTIQNGHTDRYGGIICSVGATVEISGGTISGGTADMCGGNIFHEGANGVTVSGGTITGGVASDRGGNIYVASVASNLTISGGTITKGQALAEGTAELTGGGGNIYINHGQMNITGGTISCGEGKLGGNICTNIGSVAEDKTAFIGDDGDPNTPVPLITNGIATSSGGNIYATKDLEIGVCTIQNGEAGSGGNILCNGVTTLTGTTLIGGQATYGGSVYVSGDGDATINANISGGTATDRGGNVYMSSVTCKLTITGGTIANGVCTGNDTSDISGGGNIYTNNGNFTLSGGVIVGGQAPRGGNLYTNTGANSEDNNTIINGTAILKDGEATYGGNLYLTNKVTLGAVTFQNGTGTYGSDIYVATSANLTVDTAFNGEAGIYYALNQLPNPIPGGMIAPNKNKATEASKEINRCTGVFTGKLYLENDARLPYIYAKEGDDKLYITGVALVDQAGNYTWFVNNTDAAAAYGANTKYMQAVDGLLPLNGGNYVVDLAGSDVAITGTGNVTIFDSANDDYKTYGTATIEGPVLQNTFKTTIDNKDTYMIESEGVYSFHRMGIRITGVSVRPSAAGMYYTGNWQCDELLEKKIEKFGVAVSLVDLPTAEFLSDDDTLYTAYGKKDFENGVSKTGALISDILEEGNKQSTARSRMNVYARAYVIFEDGSVAVNNGEIAYSLYKVLWLMEQNLYDYAAKADALKEFCETWVEDGVRFYMDFTLSEDEKQLHTAYSGRTAYHGEAHDHAATGGTSDGTYTLGQWKMGMEELNMDFATIVDHRQVNHMYLPDWDENLFIGGSEAMSYVSDYEEGKNKMHYNMIFTDPKGLEAVVSSFKPFDYRYNSTMGIYEFSYPSLTVAQVQELVQLVKENGGMFALVHPKSDGYIDYEDALKYWFGDWTGIEVLYGYYGYAPEQWQSDANYQLWVDLLAAGKYVWVTAGSDKHAAANTDALTTIYSEKADAETYFSHMKEGDTTCGPVGIRMCIGDAVMGSQTDFAGKRLVFSVADFHEVAYDPTHTYHVELISDTGVVYSTEFDASQPFYYGMDADDTAKFYRVEVFDDTLGLRIAIGNPIWNQ